jgi:hypothetical protein
MSFDIRTIFGHATPRKNVLRDTIWIQGVLYDLGVAQDGTIKMVPSNQPSSLRTDPPSLRESFLICGEGRCCASLLNGLLQVAWLNRYAPEVEIWQREAFGRQPFKQEPRLENARLIALSMAGDWGICAVASTPTDTLVFRCNYDGPLTFQDNDPQLLRPSSKARFSGNVVILEQQKNGCRPS